jgi:hypothetical protein
VIDIDISFDKASERYICKIIGSNARDDCHLLPSRESSTAVFAAEPPLVQT